MWVLLAFGSSCLPVGIARGQQPEHGIVFVAGGCGDIGLTAFNLDRVIVKAGLPLRVTPVDWSTGDIIEDILNKDDRQRAGQALAECVLAYRKAHPGRKVYLVSHSAGAGVILAATQALPADSVDRIVLLAPGVPSDSDLRRALTVSRGGIDNFYNRTDEYLKVWAALHSVLGGRPVRAAGDIGFLPMTATPADAELYSKLRQYPYRVEWAEIGHHGSHFGVARRVFLSHAVVPLFMTP